jgi:diphthine synthase
MLYLIGLGIGDELDISLRGLEACSKCGELCAELYTAKWGGSLSGLEKRTGKKITRLERQDLEEGSERFVRKAKRKDIALLVPGDPLTATTHMHLILDAKKHGVPFRVIHSSSIMTSVAETGLNLYNFGKTATIVRPGKSYAPTSFYDAGVANKKAGLHTLFLLDTNMDTSEGLRILQDIEKVKHSGLVSDRFRTVIASGLGTSKSVIRQGTLQILLKRPLPPPAVIIIPGGLHFMEKEFLDVL